MQTEKVLIKLNCRILHKRQTVKAGRRILRIFAPSNLNTVIKNISVCFVS